MAGESNESIVSKIGIKFPEDFPDDIREKIDEFLASEDAKALGINSFDDFIVFNLKRFLYNGDEIIERLKKEKELVQKSLPKRVRYPKAKLCNCPDVRPNECYADKKMYVIELPSKRSPLGYSTCVVHIKCKRPISLGLMKEWSEKKLPPPPMWYQVGKK